jgi:hypothetical protein
MAMSVSDRAQSSTRTVRRTIETTPTYDLAERSVNSLIDQGFPAQRIAIVGMGLRSVEQVTAKVTLGSAALQGGLYGAFLGLFWGLFLGLFVTVDDSWGWVVLYGLVAGAVFGALFSLIYQSARKGRRDFSSVATTVADHYEVQVDEAVAGEAERLMQSRPSA